MGKCERCKRKLTTNDSHGPVCKAIVEAEDALKQGIEIKNDEVGSFPKLDYVEIVGDAFSKDYPFWLLSDLASEKMDKLAIPFESRIIEELTKLNGKPPKKDEVKIAMIRAGLCIKSGLTKRYNEERARIEQKEKERVEQIRKEANKRAEEYLADFDRAERDVFIPLSEELLSSHGERINSLANYLVEEQLDEPQWKDSWVEAYKHKKTEILSVINLVDITLPLWQKGFNDICSVTIIIPESFREIYVDYLSSYIDHKANELFKEKMEEERQRKHRK